MPERPAQGQTRQLSSYFNFFVLAVRLPLERILPPSPRRRYRRVMASRVEISGFAASGTSTSGGRVATGESPQESQKIGVRPQPDQGEAEPCHRAARRWLAQSFDTRAIEGWLIWVAQQEKCARRWRIRKCSPPQPPYVPSVRSRWRRGARRAPAAIGTCSGAAWHFRSAWGRGR